MSHDTATPDETNPPAQAVDGVLRRALAAMGVSGALLVVSGGAVFGARTGAGVALGVLVAAANLVAFAYVGQALLGGRGAGWALVGLLKMLALFVVAFALFRAGLAGVLPFVVGYASLPIGVTLAQFSSPATGAGTPGPSGSPGSSRSTWSSRPGGAAGAVERGADTSGVAAGAAAVGRR